MEKMTNSKALAIAIEKLGDTVSADVIEKLTNIKASIDKKNSAERKPTVTQTENAGFKGVILDSMESGKKYTIGEIMKFEGLGDLTNQRVSAIVRQMKDEGTVVREEIKRKAYFSLAE